MITQRYGFGGVNNIESSPESYNVQLQKELYEYSYKAVKKFLN
tara:strand:+ start:186 stop:314 length:129 start_codon:yes stop_codon:yes gene_type:complete